MLVNKTKIIAIIIILFSILLIAYQATRSQSSVTFYTPAEVYVQHQQFANKLFRVSGLVLRGSKHFDFNTQLLQFRITDTKGHDFLVFYKGQIPDLFKEGQGVVVEGMLEQDWNKKIINANLLMVKHSEVYDTHQDHAQMREAKLLNSINIRENSGLFNKIKQLFN